MSGAAAPASPGGVGFADVDRVLSHFLQGLCKRRLPLEAAPDVTPDLLLGRVLNGRAVIHLPPEIDEFPQRAHNLAAYRAAALHQMGYLEYGLQDFDPAIALDTMPHRLAALLRPRVKRPVTAPALERFFHSWRRPALLRQVFSLLEAIRVDAIVRRRYPGARKDLDRMAARLLADRPDLSALPGWMAWHERLFRFSLGQPRQALGIADDDALSRRLLDVAEAQGREGASVYDSARAAIEICVRLERVIRADDWMQVIERDEESPLPPGPAMPAGRGDPLLTDKVFDITGDGEEGGAGADIDDAVIADVSRWRLSGGRTGATAPDAGTAGPAELTEAPAQDRNDSAETPSRAAFSRPRPTAPTDHPVFFYDEWDCLRQTYLKSWCRLSEKRLRGENAGFVREVRRRHHEVAERVMRQFARVRPDAFLRVRDASDGEELDTDGMIDAVIDRRAGHDSDARPYVRRDRNLREVCAAFLVDMSASTNFPMPARPPAAPADAPESNDADLYLYAANAKAVTAALDAPPQRRVIDVAKESLALMCDALQTLGDRYAIYGFSGNGREAVEFFVAKEFGDPWAMRSQAALAAMEPRRSTRLGPAIRHALTRLGRQPERMKVLIIVTDGYPQDRDYGPDPNSADYGIQDTARALQEARRGGVLPFCITIDPAGHDYLRRMCAENSYLVIDDVEALPDQLSKVYRTLTS